MLCVGLRESIDGQNNTRKRGHMEVMGVVLKLVWVVFDATMWFVLGLLITTTIVASIIPLAIYFTLHPEPIINGCESLSRMFAGLAVKLRKEQKQFKAVFDGIVEDLEKALAKLSPNRPPKKPTLWNFLTTKTT
jgi:hypothetical protein